VPCSGGLRPAVSGVSRRSIRGAEGAADRETTNYLIGNLVLRLLEDPARWDAVVADPGLIPGAVHETLRYFVVLFLQTIDPLSP
jgi:hypothetical protein